LPGLSFELAQWASGFSLEDAPSEVAHNTKIRLLDIIGVMIGSNDHESVAAAHRASADADAGGRGAHSLMAADETSSANAAFLNGVASAVLEYDDTHIASNIHVTGVVAAAALPIAQAANLSGRALLEAMITGSEIACRLGLVTSVRMHEKGFHPTSVYGVFAAAYAVARLRGLSPETIADAVGTAGSLSAGSIASFQDGTSTKTMHVGFASAAAVRAVALAKHGISGPSQVFEGRFGWYASHIQGATDFNFGALTDALGERWELLNISPKLYPCAYTMIPFIAATLALREEHAIRPEDVAEITCEIMPRSFATICEPVEEKRRPRTSWHGRISLQHTVAEALALGRFDKSAYAPASLVDPVINTLADKVIHVADPIAAADTSRSRATVSIKLHDGRLVTKTIEDMLGTSRNPAPDAVYFDKFRSNVDGVISNAEAEELIERLMSLETASDVDGLLQPLRAGRARP
jgi:2-methylcitrate dehydratase PrpD